MRGRKLTMNAIYYLTTATNFAGMFSKYLYVTIRFVIYNFIIHNMNQNLLFDGSLTVSPFISTTYN